MAKKNLKKNKLKSKVRFKNSIIANESTSATSKNTSNEEVLNFSIAPKTASSTKIQPLVPELKLIGIIGLVLVSILVISSFII